MIGNTQVSQNKIRLLENSLERTARMLASSYGIKVVFKAQEARTNGKTIYLPSIPDDAPEELIDAMQGYLDHETGHILFTDFNAVKKKGITDKGLLDVINVVEDVRIEGRMEDLFPGTSYNFQNAASFMDSTLKEQWPLMDIFNKVLCSYYDSLRYPDIFTKRTYIDPIVSQLLEQCIAVTTPTHSTDDSIEVGKKIYEILKAYVEEEETEEQESSGSGEGESDANEEGEQESASKPSLGEMISQKVSELNGDSEGSATKVHKSTSDYKHNRESDGTYLIYSTADDQIHKYPDKDRLGSGNKLQKLRDEAQQYTNVIRMRLVNSLRTMQRKRWVGNREEGKIDSRKLYKAVLGLDTKNIYKERTDALKLDTAVAMAIDHSGSMTYDRRLELAAETAIILGDVFKLIKIPFLVYGYSSEAPSDYPSDIAPYGRYNKLWIRIYSHFAEMWENGALRLANIGTGSSVKENTLDGESVKFGIQQLLLRPERRKILLVLTDGEPYPGYGHLGRCQQYLKDVIEAAKKHGVEVIGFGINTPHIGEYYPNHVNIHKVSDLVTEPLIKLDAMLRKGVRYV